MVSPAIKAVLKKLLRTSDFKKNALQEKLVDSPVLVLRFKSERIKVKFNM